MNDHDRNPHTAHLVAVEPDLAAHVLDLLDVADIPAEGVTGDSGLIVIAVPATELERARATLDLVLPGLLAEEAGDLLSQEGPPPLSGRLIRRSDWTIDPPDNREPDDRGNDSTERRGLLDGRRAFAEAVDPDDASTTYPMYEAVDDGDFVPPEPPPLPHGDVVSRFAWLGAIGGPLLMVLAALVDLPSFAAGAGLAAFVIGFGVLVARMPDRARQDDGWDDGAVL